MRTVIPQDSLAPYPFLFLIPITFLPLLLRCHLEQLVVR
jgi:hypothetical protein